MRLRRHVIRKKADGTDYASWTVTVPAWAIAAAGWKEGEELEVTNQRDGIWLRRIRGQR